MKNSYFVPWFEIVVMLFVAFACFTLGMEAGLKKGRSENDLTIRVAKYTDYVFEQGYDVGRRSVSLRKNTPHK